MKPIYVVLIVVLAALQYLLWWGDGSIQALNVLKSNATQAKAHQSATRKHNYVLVKQIDALKTNSNAIETLAREEHNMIKNDETYFQIIEQ